MLFAFDVASHSELEEFRADSSAGTRSCSNLRSPFYVLRSTSRIDFKARRGVMRKKKQISQWREKGSALANCRYSTEYGVPYFSTEN